MSGHARRWSAALVALALLAGCTSHTSALPSSVPLTPGGTVIEPSSASASVSTSASSVPSSLGTPQGMSTVSSTPTISAPPLSSSAPTTPRSTTPTKGSTTSPSTASTSVPSVSVNTSGLSAREIADRTAIEEAWVQFWDVYTVVYNSPASKREGILEKVAADPVISKILTAGASFDKQGIRTRGYVTHHIYWGPPVDGQSPAIMGDCLDTSHYGSYWSKNGQQRTVGEVGANVRGIFVRTAGTWLVSSLEDVNQPC